MDTRTVEQVNQWESRPVGGGLTGLRELAEEGFSGAVRVAGTWAFVLNGRVVGVFEGELEDFEGPDVTAYRAPDQALALLFTMQELGGQTQAKYYTNDTPLSEVHETLTNGNFSGYVELSENVLSGDYYAVYYGGRSMSAAFVGESERLLTGDEAFDRADDEVGIYEVKKVDIDVIDLSEVVDDPEPEPEPEPVADPEPEPEPQVDSDSKSESTAEPDPEPSVESEPDPSSESEPEPKLDPEPDPAASTERPEAAVDPQEPANQESETASQESPADIQESDLHEPTHDESDDTDADESVEATDSATDDSGGSVAGTDTTKARSSSESQQEETGSEEDVFSEEQQWRQAKAIPSLDPSRSGNGGQKRAHRPKTPSKKPATKGRSSAKSSTTKRSNSSTAGKSATSERSKHTSERKPSNSSEPSKPSSGETNDGEASDDGASVAEYKQALQQSKHEIERLDDQLSEAKSENQELLAQREELRSEVERLEAELKQAKANDGSTGASSGQSLPADQALEGTNLFVRYASKSQPTLEDAREGADRGEVNTNLSLEHHTQFDADEVVVGGTKFEAFLQESIQYRFVEWLVEDLLYEIRDTGHVGQLRELIDAIPKIDRAELTGNATIRKTEDGEEIRTQRTFDVILRDRMGNPLVVANLNDARDPATGDMMADLVAAANDVGETSPSLSAAVFVTASFFEPAALETTAEATGGGLLSREKKESYVKLSRKRGYHLCLVETRGGQFHVNVPEL